MAQAPSSASRPGTGTASPATAGDGDSAPPTSAGAPLRLRLWVLGACCVVAFSRACDPRLWMMGVDIAVAPFGAGWQGYRVFSTVAMLLLLAGMIAGGLLGDIVGRRRVLLGGALVSTVSGVLTMLAPAVPWFAVTRSVDAAAAGMAFPLTLAVLRLTFDGRERPLAILALTVATSGGLLAAFLAILLEEPFGWRSTLVLPTLTCAAGTYLVWRAVPESRAPAAGLRQAATAAAWALTLLPLTLGAVAARLTGSWSHPVAVTGLGLAATGLLLLGMAWRGRIRTHATAALTGPGRFQRSVMLLTGATLSFGFTGYTLQLYAYFTVVQGYGAILGGLALLPILAITLVTVRRAAQLALRSDARRVIAGGLLLMGGATATTALLLPLLPPYWLLIFPLALFGYGCLLAQTAWTTAFMSAMPDAVAGASAGIIRATASSGAVLGGALLGTVLVNAGEADFALRLAALGLSPGQATLADEALRALLRADAAADRTIPPWAVAAGLLAVYHQSYTTGVAAALGVAAVSCLAMGALAWLLLEPGRPPQRSPG